MSANGVAAHVAFTAGRWTLLVLGLVLGRCAYAYASDGFASDPFHVHRAVPVTPASALLGSSGECAFGALPAPLTLPDVVERALCNDPDTRTAWATIEQQAAAVGVSKAAYLPTLSATGQEVHDDSVTVVDGHPALSSNDATQVHSESATLDWVLYDFGGRRAALDNAKALLSVAQANDDEVLQQVFASAAKVYYAAQAAQARLTADEAVVTDAENSLTAAQARVQKGVAPVTEAYQAQTAFEQALLTQTRDRGQALAASGDLAHAMAIPLDTPITLDSVDQAVKPDAAFASSVTQLMAQAERAHPAILAAKQQLQAAEAGVRKARAQGRPTLKLVGQYSRNNEPVQLGLGLPHYPATGHDGYIGVQVSVPIFSGFATTYQVRQAQAQVDLQGVALDKAKAQVALQVWDNYQTLQTDTQNLTTSVHLQDVATLAWQSAQRRYRTGVGTILELLSTQTALAQARQQRVETLTAWRYDRLALASALGQLGPEQLKAAR